MKVGALAKRPAITISAKATIADAARVMAERRIGFLPVLDNGRLVGVVSERDLVRAAASGLSPDQPVEAVMTREVITINFNDDVEAAWALMKSKGIRHLVVLRGDEVYGVVSIRDFLAERIALERIVERSRAASLDVGR
ncbi:MAG: CBS domain-containing protein [Thermoproteus sp. AZ2]|uniref:CBS domain-containing protein n=1 Tax=Thermoproteus sp. AZ2 TaxID=1609232 RepID=A0ACC6UZS2_9CREN|nr:MAG: histidine kinase [Thermoproteus sp. AZ2]